MKIYFKGSFRFQIVIVGAGSYGIALAKILAKEVESVAEVVLVANSEEVFFHPSMVRLDVHKDLSKVAVNLKKLLENTNVKLLIDHVVNIDRMGVQLKNKGVLKYDRLVIATGAIWDKSIFPPSYYNGDPNSFPGKTIQESRKIVVVGGGPLGVELAGEYASYFPEKSVTIIHSRERLLNHNYLDKVRDRAFIQLHKLGVRILLNRRAVIKDGSVFINDSELDCDYLINCTGPKANPPPHSIRDFVNEKNEIVVTSLFRSVAHPLVFAIGDVTSFPRKGLEHRAPCIKIVVHNLKQVLQAKCQFYIADWSNKFLTSSVISIGPCDGVGQRRARFRGVVSMRKDWVVKAKKLERFPTDLPAMIRADHYHFPFDGGCDSGGGGTGGGILAKYSMLEGDEALRRRKLDAIASGSGS